MGIEYQITAANYKRHLTWRGVKDLRCSRCGKKISPGDWIHKTNASSIEGKARFYHRVCFRELFVDV